MINKIKTIALPFRSIYLLLLTLGLALTVNAVQENRTAVVLNVSEAISPATNDFIHRGLAQAAERRGGELHARRGGLRPPGFRKERAAL